MDPTKSADISDIMAYTQVETMGPAKSADIGKFRVITQLETQHSAWALQS